MGIYGAQSGSGLAPASYQGLLDDWNSNYFPPTSTELPLLALRGRVCHTQVITHAVDKSGCEFVVDFHFSHSSKSRSIYRLISALSFAVVVPISLWSLCI